jgi:uncharacterized protein YxjI
VLDRKSFLVKERVGMFKLVDTYDIFDPATGATLGTATENVSGPMKALRLIVNKRLLPTTVEVRTSPTAAPILSIKRSGFLRSTVKVLDERGNELGSFKSKFFSVGGGFLLLDKSGRQVGEVKGDWKGWNFRFLTTSGAELGKVTKKWAGIGKELFTSADNYVIALDEKVKMAPEMGAFLLAAGLAIDIVYKEKS